MSERLTPHTGAVLSPFDNRKVDLTQPIPRWTEEQRENIVRNLRRHDAADIIKMLL